MPRRLDNMAEPLGFLVRSGGASSLADPAYRLRANIASILKPPLPQEDVRQITELFGYLVGIGLDRP